MRNGSRINNRQNTTNRKLVHPISHRWREGLFILSIAIAALLVLALFTYDSQLGSWIPSLRENAAGKVGELFAYGLLYLFGGIGYVLPLALPYGTRLFSHPPEDDEWHTDYFLWRSLGFVLTLISACGLASLELHGVHPNLPMGGGGLLGDIVSFGLVATFNVIGTTILLFGLLLCGITLFSGLSWLSLTTMLGEATVATFGWLSDWLDGKRNEQRNIKRRKREPGRLSRNTEEDDEDEEDTASDSDNAEDLDEEDDIELPPIKSAAARNNRRTLKTPRRAEFSFPTEPSHRLEPVLIEDEFASETFGNFHQNNANTKTKSIPLKTQIKSPIKSGLPALKLLDPAEKITGKNYSPQMLENMSREVELRLQEFGIPVQVVAVHPGPVVTRFEMQLAPGIKVSRITGLAKDLARSLSVVSVRVVEVIPGKSVVGLELPNQTREIVRLSEVLSSPQYDQARSPLSLVLGKDIAGHPVVVDLAKMPHLLVAGTTGSGKSVGLNAMLLSLLFKATPQEVRMIMIDPKMLELSIYEGIPHLLAPVVTDMKEAANALRWCVAEMERRYKLMATLGVRNLAGYNQKITEAQEQGEPLLDPFWKPQLHMDDEQPGVLDTLPYVVVIIDEFADMIMVVGKKVEELIARIAQKARAAGIHLILATQRPSVDVITGLIKANIPTRIAFQVSSKIDSRTILDQQGAEQLLGHGDMLYLAPGTGVPVRVHGAYVADHEVHKVVDDWKQRGQPDYIEGLVDHDENSPGFMEDGSGSEQSAEQDPLYDQAVQVVIETRRASISGVQRRLKIGYNRAARLLEEMEKAGLVSPMEGNGSREVLVPEHAD